MGFLKLQLLEGWQSRSLQDKGSQAGAWEPAKMSIAVQEWGCYSICYTLGFKESLS